MKEKIQIALVSRPVFSLLLLFSILIFLSSLSIFFVEKGNSGLSFVDALFTGFSASTVTGLVVVDTHTLSLFSQIIILATMQVGGLMAIGSGAFIIILAVKIGSSRHGKVSASALVGVSWLKLWDTIRLILTFAFVVELAATLLLFLHFKDSMGLTQGFWYAIFHAVSGFFGAGFFLFEDNLYSFKNDAFMLSVMMAEITLGGIGFLVILSIKTRLLTLIRRKKIYGWPVHAKLVVLMTVILLFFGFAAFWGFEYNNVLKDESIGGQVLISLFQSVSARTAGLSTVDMGEIAPATQFFYGFLMFIGAGSISTSGGIKVATLAVVLLTIWARYKRSENIVIWKRVIPQKTIARANGVLLISLALLSIFMLAMLAIETFDFGDILFEVLSAFGTVGYSSGITSSLSDPGKILLSILMLIGRIGPLTLTYLFGREIIDETTSRLEEEVEVG